MSSDVENKGEDPFQALIDDVRTERRDVIKEISALAGQIALGKDPSPIEKAIAVMKERLKELDELLLTLAKDRAMKRAGEDDSLQRILSGSIRNATVL